MYIYYQYPTLLLMPVHLQKYIGSVIFCKKKKYKFNSNTINTTINIHIYKSEFYINLFKIHIPL